MSDTAKKKHSCLRIGGLVAALLFCLATTHTLARSASEYQVKAAFLYNFLAFTTWPNSKDTHRTICVFGTNPFEDYFHQLSTVNQKGQTVSIDHLSNLTYTDGCHILFISRSEKKHILNIIKEIEKSPLLTASDISRFAANNGMIELTIKSNKLKLIINLDSVKLSGLKLSSNLISLADVIGGQENLEVKN